MRFVGPQTLRLPQHYAPPPDVAPITDQNFGFPNYPESRFVGPAALRTAQVHYYPPPPDVAPITDTNFIYPNYSQSARTVGPTVLRLPQIHYYTQPYDIFIPPPIIPTDYNFVFPNYPPGIARSVGPAVLRQRARFSLPTAGFVLVDYLAPARNVATVSLITQTVASVDLVTSNTGTVGTTTNSAGTITIVSQNTGNI